MAIKNIFWNIVKTCEDWSVDEVVGMSNKTLVYQYDDRPNPAGLTPTPNVAGTLVPSNLEINGGRDHLIRNLSLFGYLEVVENPVENYFRLSFDDEKSDQEISNCLENQLNLVDSFRQGNINQDKLVELSVYCMIHNMYKIKNDSNPVRLYIQEPGYVRARIRLSRIINMWQKGWVVIGKRDNTNFEILKYFNKYITAEKYTNKLLKKITENNRMRNFPDYKKEETFDHQGLTIGIYKTKN